MNAANRLQPEKSAARAVFVQPMLISRTPSTSRTRCVCNDFYL